LSESAGFLRHLGENYKQVVNVIAKGMIEEPSFDEIGFCNGKWLNRREHDVTFASKMNFEKS